MKRSQLGLAVVVATLASMSTTAALAKNPRAKASFLRANATCGGNNGGPVIGKAAFERVGNLVVVKKFSLKGADPFASYTFEIWASNPVCEELSFGALLPTNKKGSLSHKEEAISVPEEDVEFFATVQDELTGYNDTPSVFLP